MADSKPLLQVLRDNSPRTFEEMRTLLMVAAQMVQAEGLQHARKDDPHRLATLESEFDAGECQRYFLIQYPRPGLARVSLSLVGKHQGEAKSLELFSMTTAAPR